MTKKEITIRLSSGLEARPVAMLVQVASQFESEIHVISGERNVNAKNMARQRMDTVRLLFKIKKAFLRGILTAECFFSLIW